MKSISVIIRIASVCCIAFCAAAAPARADMNRTTRSDIIIGAKAGYSMIEGYYKDRFRGSYCVGASFSYGNQGMVKFLRGEFDVNYSRYPMKESAKSYLESATFALGPLFYYPFLPHFQIYIGASATGSYLHLYANKSRQNEKAFKPGFLAKAGFMFPIKDGVRLNTGAEYSLLYLSGKALHVLNFTGGISYNFNTHETDVGVAPSGDPAVRIDWYMTLAGNALRKGDVAEAKVNYQKVIDIDRTNSEARDQLAGIKKAEEDYTAAMKQMREKRYYEALPLLESSGKYLPAAREEQEKIRLQLSADIAQLEKQGIELYEKGDYRGCIAVMNRLLLINPKNKVGLIYLPRAVKRQGALERLR